ncbi:MAG: hypothetical protein JW833_15995 [Prolixibacteraceae bacterium]|nr:hypothetical protein [Prolixibacteraceae bacterium]
MSHQVLNILTINFMSRHWLIFYTCLATFIVNLPFGYFRARFRKLTFLWFLMIHLAVPFVILIRKFFGVNLSWSLAPFLVGSFFLGQFVGTQVYKKFHFRKKSKF